MKKNVMMRLACFLLVAVLISTSAISGTYAKYVTKGEGADAARVAKFGVTVEAKTTMFAKEYKTDDTTYKGELSVESSTKDNVLAPGTTGKMVDLAVVGEPEVATRITYTPEVELGNNWIDKLDTTKFYCPLKVTVKTNVETKTLCGLDYDSADEFESAIEALIVAAKMDYAPNEDLATINDDLTISWEWPFEGSTYINGTGHEKQLDEKDTFLGNRAADLLDNAGTIDVSLVVTVTQIN